MPRLGARSVGDLHPNDHEQEPAAGVPAPTFSQSLRASNSSRKAFVRSTPRSETNARVLTPNMPAPRRNWARRPPPSTGTYTHSRPAACPPTSAPRASPICPPPRRADGAPRPARQPTACGYARASTSRTDRRDSDPDRGSHQPRQPRGSETALRGTDRPRRDLTGPTRIPLLLGSDAKKPGPSLARACGTPVVWAHVKWRRWWRRWDSNPRPPACKAGALPAELRPLSSSLLQFS